MTLDDLLIYGDWLEENDIKNGVYKLFINYLRIELRRNDQYGFGGDKNFNYLGGGGSGYGIFNERTGGGYGSVWANESGLDHERGNGNGSGYCGYNGSGKSI